VVQGFCTAATVAARNVSNQPINPRRTQRMSQLSQETLRSIIHLLTVLSKSMEISPKALDADEAIRDLCAILETLAEGSPSGRSKSP
jgi:hypothetical protein